MLANCRGPAAKPATSVVPDVPHVTVSLSVPDSSRTSSLPRPPGRSPISGLGTESIAKPPAPAAKRLEAA
ncbi:hypothetical protein DA456_21095 [Pseudomonas syringae pv. atrofaciens]|uniref:Uncharacterized protein n=1 Tax=Pseudomonas syringae pv. atrofaciens TaxID=192087 RepID=A0AAD0IC39_PSESX|nr:hypothetical protein DA456_21095 [Pseudomonas syringae pv. atrofaciens]UZA82109.1 hypothetical protein EZZ79_25460 [Pseudomonas syringae]